MKSFFPGLPKEKLDPDDCPACEGAGGQFVQTGCFSKTAQKCKTCHGKRKLSKEGLLLYNAAPLLNEADELIYKIGYQTLKFFKSYAFDDFLTVQKLCDDYKKLEEKLSEMSKDIELKDTFLLEKLD